MVKIRIDNEPYEAPNGKTAWETERGAKIVFSRMNGKEERLRLENSGRLQYIEFEYF